MIKHTPYFGDYEPTYKEYLVIMSYKGQKESDPSHRTIKNHFLKLT